MKGKFTKCIDIGVLCVYQSAHSHEYCFLMIVKTFLLERAVFRPLLFIKKKKRFLCSQCLRKKKKSHLQTQYSILSRDITSESKS